MKTLFYFLGVAVSAIFLSVSNYTTFEILGVIAFATVVSWMFSVSLPKPNSQQGFKQKRNEAIFFGMTTVGLSIGWVIVAALFQNGDNVPEGFFWVPGVFFCYI